MTDLSVSQTLGDGSTAQLARRVRFITAASLFDGHDAAINIMRRILQSAGCEVIHLGHNRSVEEVVTAALHEDAQGIAVSSYQGGHLEYFKFMIDLLRERGGGNIKVFGGGGGVIIPEEIRALHAYGVERIYSPEDGQQMGLTGMIDDMLRRCAGDTVAPVADLSLFRAGKRSGSRGEQLRALAILISALENGTLDAAMRKEIVERAASLTVPTLGVTGTGGSGKSSLTDELIRRFRLDQEDRLNIAVIAVDPSRRKSGGALLGDRIRMNSISGGQVFMRSLATRDTGSEISAALPEVIAACKIAGFDLVVIETSGIGQGNAAIVPHVNAALYVMTPEFGAASQLEKIDMLDFADFVAINKFDRKGAQDALRDVSKQVQRNREAFRTPADEMPVFGTIASRFNDDGVTALYQALAAKLLTHGLKLAAGRLPKVAMRASSGKNVIVPSSRSRYLAEICDTTRAYRRHAEEQSGIARERLHLRATKAMLSAGGQATATLDPLIQQRDTRLDARSKKLLEMWPQLQAAYAGD